MKVYDELVARGLIAQVTNEPEIREMVNNGKATFYIGFDPTADSPPCGPFYGPVSHEAAADGGKSAHCPHWRRYRHDWRPLRSDGHALHDDQGDH